jgi:hypothetical protein
MQAIERQGFSWGEEKLLTKILCARAGLRFKGGGGIAQGQEEGTNMVLG